MESVSTPNLETILAHAGCTVDPATGAVIAPIHLATTFERDADGAYPRSYEYSRADNPTRRLFETTLASLEGGASAAAFSSGMAAAMTIFQSLKPGDHVIMPDDVYHGVRVLATGTFTEWGLQHTTVDMSNLDAIERALRPETRLVWIETPSNPLLKITDIAAVARLAHQAGAEVLVDNTWATPLLQRPLVLGADFVLHSVTKYLAGHSDVLGGAIVARQTEGLFGRVRKLQAAGGAVMDPFGAWLALRGMRSLAARMRVHCENARIVAGFLSVHPAVERVHYPSLASHPGHEVATRQMRDFGGMISVEVRGGQQGAMAVAAAARVFRRATSLGGTESLIEHRASVEAPPTRTPSNLLRLSVGLEHPDDLIGDLRAALSVLDA
ncbi:MAG: aminotransferase class V-fold PLP-dependent enzyme [Rhodothermales bacterium]|nr:aminotransferase class V-fold PLP-dependent enzyme [Rhodothermales bacterium]